MECLLFPVPAPILLSLSLLLATTASLKDLEYNIREERPVNTVVGNVLVDASLHEKYAAANLRKLTFSFLDKTGRHTRYLDLGSKTGQLKTIRRIDRDTLCPGKIVCHFDVDIAVGPQEFFEILKVLVHITDINDNRPKFPQESIRLTISEGKPTGIIANLPEAYDPDSGENKIQGYKLSSASVVFKINTIGGGLKLVLTRPLDREKSTNHKLTIVAYDGGIHSKSSSLTIHITVTDINDNFPKFQNATYKAWVLENVTVHSSILQVRAQDADAGVNGQVTYRFSRETKSEYGRLFDLEKDTGIIYVIGKLNYQRASVYELWVQARDNGPEAVSVKTKVTIFLVDVNDHAPEINLHSLTDSGALEVTENSAQGTFIAHISVIDQDGGKNARFTCSLNTRNFRLHELQGKGYKIVTENTLDRETQATHSFRIACSDHGQRPLSSSRPFTVVVLDVNDNAPVFSRQTYFAKILENGKVGKLVAKVNATDRDSGKNAEIVYSFANHNNGMLHIDKKSGTITTRVRFNHEKVQTMEFTLLATDQGAPAFTASATLFLTILDENDESPKFSVPNYDFHVQEGQPAGTRVGRVYATDADTDPYNKFTFSVDGVDEISSAFTIDAQDGGIRTARVFYRNNGTHYHFVVVAREIEAPWSTSKANVSVYLVDKAGSDGIHYPENPSMPMENLFVILGLSGALIFMLCILILVVIIVYRRRGRRNVTNRGYISGNLVRVTRHDADVIRLKGDLVCNANEESIDKLYDITSSTYPSFEKSDFMTQVLQLQHSNDGIPHQALNSPRVESSGALSTPGGSPRQSRGDKRRANQASKAGDGRGRNNDSRRKAADGASDTRVPYNRTHGSRSRLSSDRERKDGHVVHSLRRQRRMKDSDSACSADVSNSDSGNCASDDPDGHRSRDHSTLNSKNKGGHGRNRGSSKKTDTRRVKAESLSSPDSEIQNAAQRASRDDSPAGPSGANRIALVHPQRNGEKQSDDELGEESSLSGLQTQNAPECQESEIGIPSGRQYDIELDSDSGSSEARIDLSNRAGPDGQTQVRPPKTNSTSDKGVPFLANCVNDTDFYESDSESRGRNILV